ncbi:MSMEG_1061 family FMN-dependent PPOX-type flavoprotein [Ammoniphilus sp. YIM 78166]|uniref:MSMEG_1061 family FMN-dependent PPOX-type flavoprotein n=1 Tax=Ammoniphilus sp. YIM 78166 TaxID=1644106 RepID=UPI00106FC2AF|nr:MSMEG_1061 family FMN-dependent PPOX-type flavoprotein [Ammoniphilus sp. YIM 78166]
MNNNNLTAKAIRTEKELREFVGTPHEAVIRKTISIIDEHCQTFLSMSPLLFLSTSDAEGRCDVSPRGDHSGFVHVLDEKHLVIPDKPGNRRADSMLNILSNPQVGLLFLIPGMEWVLRINGSASVMRTADVLATAPADKELPALSIVVEVEECFIHCPRALNKAQIWKAESWPQAKDLPSPEEIFHGHLKLNGMTLKE